MLFTELNDDILYEICLCLDARSRLSVSFVCPRLLLACRLASTSVFLWKFPSVGFFRSRIQLRKLSFRGVLVDSMVQLVPASVTELECDGILTENREISLPNVTCLSLLRMHGLLEKGCSLPSLSHLFPNLESLTLEGTKFRWEGPEKVHQNPQKLRHLVWKECCTCQCTANLDQFLRFVSEQKENLSLETLILTSTDNMEYCPVQHDLIQLLMQSPSRTSLRTLDVVNIHSFRESSVGLLTNFPNLVSLLHHSSREAGPLLTEESFRDEQLCVRELTGARWDYSEICDSVMNYTELENAGVSHIERFWQVNAHVERMQITHMDNVDWVVDWIRNPPTRLQSLDLELREGFFLCLLQSLPQLRHFSIKVRFVSEEASLDELDTDLPFVLLPCMEEVRIYVDLLGIMTPVLEFIGSCCVNLQTFEMRNYEKCYSLSPFGNLSSLTTLRVDQMYLDDLVYFPNLEVLSVTYNLSDPFPSLAAYNPAIRILDCNSPDFKSLEREGSFLKHLRSVRNYRFCIADSHYEPQILALGKLPALQEVAIEMSEEDAEDRSVGCPAFIQACVERLHVSVSYHCAREYQ